jgi:hypothetical protein
MGAGQSAPEAPARGCPCLGGRPRKRQIHKRGIGPDDTVAVMAPNVPIGTDPPCYPIQDAPHSSSGRDQAEAAIITSRARKDGFWPPEAPGIPQVVERYRASQPSRWGTEFLDAETGGQNRPERRQAPPEIERAEQYRRKSQRNGLSRGGVGICGFVELDGGHDRDRTCDPYHVKVVLSR